MSTIAASGSPSVAIPPAAGASGKYTMSTIDPASGGISDKIAGAVAASVLPPPELSIGELLIWMQKTMEKTDKSIRDKMNAMVTEQNVTKSYSDAIAALNTMEEAAKGSGGKAVPSKAFDDAMAAAGTLPPGLADAMGAPGAAGSFKDDLTDGSVETATIGKVRDALKDAMQANNASHEMQMIELQSDISSRQQKFQMISAMAKSLDETADKIINRFG